MSHYDVIVIGAGSGNSIIDPEFAVGRTVALVQSGTFGGTCLNAGCIPTKMYVYPADLAWEATHDGPRLGVHSRVDGVEWATIRDRIFGRIDAIESAGHDYRAREELADLYLGRARFVGTHELEVTLDDGGTTRLTADQIVIATGGRPRIPAIPGLDDVPFHTSDTVMRLEELPRRVGIVGGGYIGSEFAHVFSAYGAHVVQIHRQPLLLNALDADLAAAFTEAARARWDVRTHSQVARVRRTDTGIELDVVSADGSEGAVEVDVLLIAAGRIPNNDLLEVGTAGVVTNELDLIEVDEFQRTNVAGIWALGDACNTPALKHVANLEARIVRHNIMNPTALEAAERRFAPAAVFSHPQIATVGLTEAEAREAGHAIAVKVQAYGDVAYGWAMDDSDHFVKLIADRATGQLLGAHLIGPMASVLIQQLIHMMTYEQSIRGVARGQYWIHPSLSEVIENAFIGLEELLDP